MLNELEESPIIGENIEGFISCIESGARGVSGPAPAKDRFSNRLGSQNLATELRKVGSSQATVSSPC